MNNRNLLRNTRQNPWRLVFPTGAPLALLLLLLGLLTCYMLSGDNVVLDRAL